MDGQHFLLIYLLKKLIYRVVKILNECDRLRMNNSSLIWKIFTISRTENIAFAKLFTDFQFKAQIISVLFEDRLLKFHSRQYVPWIISKYFLKKFMNYHFWWLVK